ncbi:MAG: hemolysin family protein [Treponema sp.]|nr:hemolysin family protein [Treponema sp.]
MGNGSISLLHYFFILVIPVFVGSFLYMLKTALAGVRLPRLHSLVEAGEEKYRPVVEAAEKPTYLTSLKIGTLFLEILSGSLGVLFYFVPLHASLSSLCPLPAGAIGAFSIIIIAFAIMLSFFIMGGVILRQIALVFPEALCSAFIPIIHLVYIVSFPLIVADRHMSALIKKMLSAASSRRGMTEEELHLALLEGEKSGVVESEERTMVEGVFYLGGKLVSAFMTHRSEIEWIDLGADRAEARKKIENFGSQLYFPVAKGDPDEVVGVVSALDLTKSLLTDPWPGLESIMRSPYFIPETMSALKAFEAFKNADAICLLVMDEYGGFAGMLTVRSLIEEIVGGLSASSAKEETIVKQEDGSWLADGGVSIDEAAAELELTSLGDEQSEYHTLAGFILYLAGEIPKPGASFDYNGFRFKIINMDGNRIDKIIIQKIN